MKQIDVNKLILEKEAFSKTEIEKRMIAGGFNSLAKFELFIWDLEMFLQFQKKLGEKIILKGGAATQFYIPISTQRTSIDIDMICLANPEDVHDAIHHVENELNGVGEYGKLKLHEPKNPKVGLNALETYFEVVPSICGEKELYSSNGKQQVKIEFLFSKEIYEIQKIKKPELFALETEKEFNILAFNHLFADKLTTLGPNTIGVSDERADEQLKQVYDVITLFISNMSQVFRDKEEIRTNYYKAALVECKIHHIEYDQDKLLVDMILFIRRIKNIENDSVLMQRANDFQSLYLRKSVKRDKTEWAIVGYQLELLVNYIFNEDRKVLEFEKIKELIEELKFSNIKGPEKGNLNNLARKTLIETFSSIEGLTQDLFKKRMDRIVWELAAYIEYDELRKTINKIT